MMKRKKESKKNKRRQEKCYKKLNRKIKWLSSGKNRKKLKRENYYKSFIKLIKKCSLKNQKDKKMINL